MYISAKNKVSVVIYSPSCRSKQSCFCMDTQFSMLSFLFHWRKSHTGLEGSKWCKTFNKLCKNLQKSEHLTWKCKIFTMI